MDKEYFEKRLAELTASREQTIMTVSAHDGAMGEIRKLLQELEEAKVAADAKAKAEAEKPSSKPTVETLDTMMKSKPKGKGRANA